MNPLRETFHILYANRLKRHDRIAAFRALVGTTIFAYLNLLVATILTDPFTGYLSWLAKHGFPTLAVIALSGIAIGTVQYFCWIANGKLERERRRIEHGPPPRPILVYAYIATSFFALPVAGILMDHLKT